MGWQEPEKKAWENCPHTTATFSIYSPPQSQFFPHQNYPSKSLTLCSIGFQQKKKTEKSWRSDLWGTMRTPPPPPSNEQTWKILDFLPAKLSVLFTPPLFITALSNPSAVIPDNSLHYMEISNWLTCSLIINFTQTKVRRWTSDDDERCLWNFFHHVVSGKNPAFSQRKKASISGGISNIFSGESPTFSVEKVQNFQGENPEFSGTMLQHVWGLKIVGNEATWNKTKERKCWEDSPGRVQVWMGIGLLMCIAEVIVRASQ